MGSGNNSRVGSVITYANISVSQEQNTDVVFHCTIHCTISASREGKTPTHVESGPRIRLIFHYPHALHRIRNPMLYSFELRAHTLIPL